jgi:hypothetical protein
MDDARSALVSLVASLRLRIKKPGAVAASCHAVLGEVQAEEVGWKLISRKDGLSGLPIDEKTSTKQDLQRVLELSTMSDGSTPRCFL